MQWKLGDMKIILEIILLALLLRFIKQKNDNSDINKTEETILVIKQKTAESL